MQLDTQKKKIALIITVSIAATLVIGALSVYALKQYYINQQVEQREAKAALQKKRIATAPEIEKEADSLFANGDLTAAKTEYQKAAVIYAEASDTVAEERVTMQLALIEHRLKSTPAESPDLSAVPIDRKLDARLGVPAPISKP